MLPGGSTNNLRDLERVSRVGSVLHRSCPTSDSGRLDHDLSGVWTISCKPLHLFSTVDGTTVALEENIKHMYCNCRPSCLPQFFVISDWKTPVVVSVKLSPTTYSWWPVIVAITHPPTTKSWRWRPIWGRFCKSWSRGKTSKGGAIIFSLNLFIFGTTNSRLATSVRCILTANHSADCLRELKSTTFGAYSL